MFEKKDDGEWGYSRRFWVQAVILALLIIAIGYSTQRTATRTENLSRETISYAQQTNDCLQQLLTSLNSRTDDTKELDKLIDDRSAVVDQRAQLWQQFIVDLAQISTDLPQHERDRLAAPIIAKFLSDTSKVEAQNAQINKDRQAALLKRAGKTLPDPTCGNKLPGQ